VVQEGRDEVTKQSPPMLRLSPELSSFFPVSHGVPLGSRSTQTSDFHCAATWRPPSSPMTVPFLPKFP
jgi:hypothetical protein